MDFALRVECAETSRQQVFVYGLMPKQFNYYIHVHFTVDSLAETANPDSATFLGGLIYKQ